MNKKKIRNELKGMTDMFCATFHQCAEQVLKNPSLIPKEYFGKESEYIGQVCMKEVVKKVK